MTVTGANGGLALWPVPWDYRAIFLAGMRAGAEIGSQYESASAAALAVCLTADKLAGECK